MRWAVVATAACALVAIAAGPDTRLGWAAYCTEPIAAIIGFTIGRALQRRQQPTA